MFLHTFFFVKVKRDNNANNFKKEIVANISTHVGQNSGPRYPCCIKMWFSCILDLLYQQKWKWCSWSYLFFRWDENVSHLDNLWHILKNIFMKYLFENGSVHNKKMIEYPIFHLKVFRIQLYLNIWLTALHFGKNFLIDAKKELLYCKICHA